MMGDFLTLKAGVADVYTFESTGSACSAIAKRMNREDIDSMRFQHGAISTLFWQMKGVALRERRREATSGRTSSMVG